MPTGFPIYNRILIVKFFTGKCLRLLPHGQTLIDPHCSRSQPPHLESAQRTTTTNKIIAKKKDDLKKICARWIAHSMRSFQTVQDPGFKAVVEECLKIGKRFLLNHNLIESKT
jgi:hypothetical protein